MGLNMLIDGALFISPTRIGKLNNSTIFPRCKKSTSIKGRIFTI